MLKTNLTMALRALLKHKRFTVINLLGLAVGLAVCLTIGLYIQHELRYDRFLPESDRVVRLLRQIEPGDPFTVRMPLGVETELRAQVPAFAHVTPIDDESRVLMEVGDRSVRVDRVLLTDSAFFQVFPYPLLQGNPEQALAGPSRIVLTTSAAAQLFGEADPMGQTISYLTPDGPADVTVTGVMADPPSHTHLRFEALRSRTPVDWALDGRFKWNYFNQPIYAQLAENATTEAAEAQITAFKDATIEAEWMQSQVMRVEAAQDAHLISEVNYDLSGQSDVRFLYLFGAIGLFILLIACINYTNLATAQATMRTREVGVRKVLGARPGQLTGQFLLEAVMVSVLALPLALGLTQLALPFVGRFLEADLTAGGAWSAPIVGGVVAMVLLVGLVAGSYPALFLTRYRPAQVLKGRVLQVRGGQATIRRGLVVVQFAAALVLLVSTFVVQDQLQYIQERDLGFDAEYVVSAEIEGLGEQHDAFMAALERQPSVVSASYGQPLGLGFFNVMTSWEDDAETAVPVVNVGYDYFETLGIPITEGQSFASATPGDPVSTLVINTAMARLLEIEGDAVGRPVLSDNLGFDGVTVRGVLSDVHNSTLHREAGRPLLFRLNPTSAFHVVVRLQPGAPQQALAEVQETWRTFVPDRPLDLQFLDEQIAAQYRAETRLAQIFSVFTALAIFVACLGLFGLAAFATVARTKEIGVRKVLGATVAGLVATLSAGFLRLVIVAFVVAAPIAYVTMERWLEGFAYRTPLGLTPFLLAVGLALLVATVAVGAQAARAAVRNPVEALRYE
ncbi:MAG: ABC transporter permease [Bacteroidota bacterium]